MIEDSVGTEGIEDIQEEHIREILKVLFILDGYDETTGISDPLANSKKDIIIKKIIEEYPNVRMEIQSKFDRQIENVEFKAEDIYKYIDNYFDNISKGDKTTTEYSKERPKKYIGRNESIKLICRIPVNLELLCVLWNERYRRAKNTREIEKIGESVQDNTDLTVTDLYYEMTNLLIKRYISKHKVRGIKNIHLENTDLPNTNSVEIEKYCKGEYELLERLAFATMKKGEVIITAETIRDLKISSKNIQVLKSIGKERVNTTKIIDTDHYFIHLTFQEFFAARYIRRALASDDWRIVREALEFIEENKYSRMYERVMQFTSGLLVRDEYIDRISNNNNNNENNTKRAISLFWYVIVNGRADLLIRKQMDLIITSTLESKFDERIKDKDKIEELIKQD
ncbi:MAG: hypothetical protein EOP34_06840, partial [Rickettsiales bacterium]